MSEMSSKFVIYHEKQVKELCALHALNNLFQCQGTYSKAELDSICSRLSPNAWFNPHRSVLGLGNYDINVIMAALQKKGCEAIWFDKRKDPSCLRLQHIVGFILNVPSDYRLGFVSLPLWRRHWVAVRRIGDCYYNLDSKLEAPLLIGQDPNLITYLKEQLECKEKELFVIVTKEVEQNQLWMLPNHSVGQSVMPNDPVGHSVMANHPVGQNESFPVPNSDSADSLSSYPDYDYRNRDAQCLKLGEVRNCVDNHF